MSEDTGSSTATKLRPFRLGTGSGERRGSVVRKRRRRGAPDKGDPPSGTETKEKKRASGPSGGPSGATQQSGAPTLQSGAPVLQSGAPTQQVTVAAPSGQFPQSAGLGALMRKVEELLQETRAQKAKTKQKSSFAKAKKQYRAYRKQRLAEAKATIAKWKKQGLARIRKMPAPQRKGARAQLKKQLAQRLDKVKRVLPSKVETPGQLRSILGQKIKSV